MTLPPYATDPAYRALVAAVHADRADETARLVLADWVQDQGDEAEAGAIRARRSLAVDFEPTMQRAALALNSSLSAFATALVALVPSVETLSRTLARSVAPLLAAVRDAERETAEKPLKKRKRKK